MTYFGRANVGAYPNSAAGNKRGAAAGGSNFGMTIGPERSDRLGPGAAPLHEPGRGAAQDAETSTRVDQRTGKRKLAACSVSLTLYIW